MDRCEACLKFCPLPDKGEFQWSVGWLWLVLYAKHNTKYPNEFMNSVDPFPSHPNHNISTYANRKVILLQTEFDMSITSNTPVTIKIIELYSNACLLEHVSCHMHTGSATLHSITDTCSSNFKHDLVSNGEQHLPNQINQGESSSSKWVSRVFSPGKIPTRTTSRFVGVDIIFWCHENGKYAGTYLVLHWSGSIR